VNLTNIDSAWVDAKVAEGLRICTQPVPKPRIYLAGPMSGCVLLNFPAFDEARDWLNGIGWNAISPADLDRNRGIDPAQPLPDWFTLEDALHLDFHEITHPDCHDIALLPLWAYSDGSKKEVRTAMDVGHSVYLYCPEGIAHNLDKRLVPISHDEVRHTIEAVEAQEKADAAFFDQAAKSGSSEYHFEDGEWRETSPTGGQKGKKLAQLGAVDPGALLELAKVAGFGTEKYERYNFLKGYDYSLTFDACMRHLLQFWSGENLDAETGLYHTAAAAWHCLTMTSFLLHGLGTDNRPFAGVEDLHQRTSA
jgi:hypothetical protein